MDKKLAEWFAGRDTGLSSQSIALYLSAGVATHCTPSDSSDFGRCHRLLAHMGWQDRIGEMASMSNRWAVLTEIWPTLTAAYLAEDYKEVYRLIKGVEADGYERDGYTVTRRPDGTVASAFRGSSAKVDLGNGVSMEFGR